MAKQEWTRP